VKGYKWGLRIKYNLNQPRVPAGDPRGGQWTRSGYWTGQIDTPIEDLLREEPRYWRRVLNVEAVVDADTVDFGKINDDDRVEQGFADEYMSNEFSDWEESLTNEEREALSDYAAEGYKPVNSFLRKGAADGVSIVVDEFGSTVTYDYEHMIPNIDSAISKGSVPKNMILYRGKKSAVGRSNFKVGDEFIDRGFVSTTIYKGLAESVAGASHAAQLGRIAYVFKTRVPKGVNAAYLSGSNYDEDEMGEVKPWSIGKTFEGEVLLGRKHIFRVVKVTGDQSKPGIVEIELELKR